MNTYDVQETRAEVVWSPSIRIGYLIHLIVKLGFEFIFFYTVYWYQTRQTKVTLVDLNLTATIRGSTGPNRSEPVRLLHGTRFGIVLGPGPVRFQGFKFFSVMVRSEVLNFFLVLVRAGSGFLRFSRSWSDSGPIGYRPWIPGPEFDPGNKIFLAIWLY